MAMTWEDFLEDVLDCATAFINDSCKHAANYDEVHDIMLTEDCVTGAGSGSYSCDRAASAETIEGILDDEYVLDKFLALGYEEIPTDDPETVEVIVRQLALDEQFDVLEDIFNNR